MKHTVDKPQRFLCSHSRRIPHGNVHNGRPQCCVDNQGKCQSLDHNCPNGRDIGRERTSPAIGQIGQANGNSLAHILGRMVPCRAADIHRIQRRKPVALPFHIHPEIAFHQNKGGKPLQAHQNRPFPAEIAPTRHDLAPHSKRLSLESFAIATMSTSVGHDWQARPCSQLANTRGTG